MLQFNITERQRVWDHLIEGRPTIVYYYNGGPDSVHLHRVLKELESHHHLEEVVVVRVPTKYLGEDFINRRALRTFPTISFHNGGYEFERLTGYCNSESILQGLLRLCQFINTSEVG